MIFVLTLWARTIAVLSMIIIEPEVTIGDLGNEKLTKHHHTKPEAMRKQGSGKF